MVKIGSQTEREIDDYQLSRFACYLIAQNGDSRKPEIARAQQYFAIQTGRQELSNVTKRLKNAKPILALDSKDASGLITSDSSTETRT